MRGLLFLIFTLTASSLVAQKHLPDSIKNKFEGIAQDSNYVNSLNQAATIYLRTNPHASRMVSAYTLEVSSNIKYTRGYARALTIIGNSYWFEGIYEFAQNYYLLAARQYQSIQDSIGLGQTFNNIGEVYKKLNEYDKALEYLLKSAELKKNDSTTYALTLYNIGELYIALNQIDLAKKYIHDSFEYARRENNKRVIAFNYWSLASIKLKEKDYKGALDYYFDAEKIWKETGEPRSLIQTYQDVAEVYREKGDLETAELYLKKAIALASRVKVADLQVNNYLRYARLDSLRGNYARALIHLSRHNNLKDSVYNLLKAEQIARLQTIYETEGREQENQQLRGERELKNAELATQRITLIAISTILFIAGILALILYRQRKKIFFQKQAIEVQATALLKLNEALQSLNKTLEIRIDERTTQLTVQNQRLTEYIFINAHKLRAPVASILGLISLLNQKNPAEYETILAHLKTCGEQLDKIINEVSRNLEDAIVNDSQAKKMGDGKTKPF